MGNLERQLYKSLILISRSSNSQSWGRRVVLQHWVSVPCDISGSSISLVASGAFVLFLEAVLISLGVRTGEQFLVVLSGFLSLKQGVNVFLTLKEKHGHVLCL